jgi:hypothetical protein
MISTASSLLSALTSSSVRFFSSTTISHPP